ncbi:MAG: baseplate assembly protein [Salinicola sp.]|uniref:baseplate assembly protein n=1 Tax=uncultured Salinicola sp. TaxID=1193542 RepID=UPI000C932D2B|nr:baseplate J/gp47 family protein [uncultured Salinicola sp.]MAM57366.1 baseplate assembly protein [Salinicola sp.]|tara:strand:+ start:217 stop:1116 length:900 start_codon:yes stop_codon:yes gene_type:complete
MSGGFTAVDLSRLPAPDVVESIEFETIFEAMLADLRARDPSFDVTVESDPAYKVLQVAAYREMLLRQRINEAAKGVMLAYAIGSDLDQLGALYGVERQMLDAGDPDAVPPVPASYETDADFRRRIQLSLEGFSTAGPEGAYVFHALSADGAVLDASATSPAPGEVLVTVLSRNDNGNAPASLLNVVDATLSAEDVRPLTDHVTVQSAEIIEYRIDATLYFYAGPDREVVMSQAQGQAATYAEQQHRLGLDVTLSGLYAALHQPGVQRVELASPAASIVVDRTQATYCTGIDLTDGGLDE